MTKISTKNKIDKMVHTVAGDNLVTKKKTELQSKHYSDVITGAIASKITSLAIVYSTVFSDADQRKHQSSVSLAFVWGIHRWPVNSPHKWPVTRKMFPFDGVIMFQPWLWLPEPIMVKFPNSR